MCKNFVFSLLYIIQMGMIRQIDFSGGVSVYDRLHRKTRHPVITRPGQNGPSISTGTGRTDPCCAISPDNGQIPPANFLHR